MAAPTPPPKSLLSFLYNVSYDSNLSQNFRSFPDDVMRKNFNLSPEVRNVLTQIGQQCSNKPLDRGDPAMKALFDQLLGFLGDELVNDISPTFW
ncbi:MAG: hypothetical protein ACLQAT_11575 [Candidatus Binataceae bacterium]